MRAARRLARRSARAEQRLFLAEGPQAVREALTLPQGVTAVFGSAEAASAHPDVRTAASRAGVTWHTLDEATLASLTDTVHPQGLVAVCTFLDLPLPDVVTASSRLVVACADVRDPGNAGTVIRCADAAGADGVVLAGSSVDPYNPKVVRASAGSLFHLPLGIERDVAAVAEQARRYGLQILAADGGGDTDLDDAAEDGTLGRPSLWLFGNEAWGLPVQVSRLADRRVAIPVHGRAESLNLATAAAVCLYASARAQRRSAAPRPE